MQTATRLETVPLETVPLEIVPLEIVPLEIVPLETHEESHVGACHCKPCNSSLTHQASRASDRE